MPRDTPRSRYYSHLRAGSSETGAARFTADSYGLAIYASGVLGLNYSAPINWTLREISQLLFVAYRAQTSIGGPNDRPQPMSTPTSREHDSPAPAVSDLIPPH